MIELRTTSPDDTRLLASTIARQAEPGDVILLVGEMGAGKTAFAQGFGLGLGVADTITSPTFTLVRHYTARLQMHHVDVYRLEHLQEVLDLGINELLDDGGVTLIEWGDAVIPALPHDFLEVHLNHSDIDEHRDVSVRHVGPSWAGRWESLCEALDYWTGR